MITRLCDQPETSACENPALKRLHQRALILISTHTKKTMGGRKGHSNKRARPEDDTNNLTTEPGMTRTDCIVRTSRKIGTLHSSH